MATEIELKAYIRNPESIRKRLARFARFEGNFRKIDKYFRRTDNGELDVRIRTTAGDKPPVVTIKEKSLQSGIEVNNEVEFSVDPIEEFESFLEMAGYIPLVEKIKTGELFIYNEMNIEVTHVEGLGDFIEIEKIAENPDKTEIEIIKKRLLALLQNCGVKDDDIEPRYYIDLLLKLKGNAQTR